MHNQDMDPQSIEEYIAKNNRALEEITGYKIEEYSAPLGAHPQPLATQVLERLGMIAYYYCGDSGSAPNRTFSDGGMVSEHVVAFPVTNFGKPYPSAR
jgi:peptidoglycan/xylan/chitin deacetylase (PgdA/CDA1 family)